MIRTYRELISFPTFRERFEYLAIGGSVGAETFGHDRYLNQKFYMSHEWRKVRRDVIARDYGMDLGVDGHDIHPGERILVHHMNPMISANLLHGDMDILNPDFLITTKHDTHNAIHYGDFSLIPKDYVPRTKGDTKLW